MDDVSHKISLICSEINNNYRLHDGSWGNSEAISTSQRINGAMKILTGFDAAGIKTFDYPEKLIDLCLSASNDTNACDHFNIICVLYYCSRLTNYRNDNIREFAYARLRLYEKYYWPECGGFSFHKHHSQDNYYGAKVSLSYPEPDIHGTLMFLWGITLISEILGWSEELSLIKPIT